MSYDLESAILHQLHHFLVKLEVEPVKESLKFTIDQEPNGRFQVKFELNDPVIIKGEATVAQMGERGLKRYYIEIKINEAPNKSLEKYYDKITFRLNL